jgi:5'-nucleotidase
LKTPLILITNDDGYQAAGIQALARAVATLGDVYVVAPDGARSGAAASISSATPVSIRAAVPDVSASCFPSSVRLCACSGTPVDCVKLALEQVVPRRPNLILSGINHGDNASISVHYSGTMGAVLEGCMKGIPSVGVTLWLPRRERYEEVPVPEDTLAAIAQLCQRVIAQGLPQDTCLNINLPPANVFRGWRVCRQARGQWTAEWLPLTEFPEQRSFQLTGQFTDLEPEAPDTDFAALRAGYASIVPVTIDMTAHAALSFLKDTLIPQP